MRLSAAPIQGLRRPIRPADGDSGVAMECGSTQAGGLEGSKTNGNGKGQGQGQGEGKDKDYGRIRVRVSR